MIPGDLMRRQQLRRVETALAVAGSLLTDDEAIAAGIGLENQSRDVITQLLLMNQPTESQRSGPLLQLLTTGAPEQFGMDIHGVVVLVLQALALAAQDDKFRNELWTPRAVMKGLTLGVRPFYDQAAATGAGAQAIAALGAMISPGLLFTAVGASPARMGSMYVGNESVKGRLGTMQSTPIATPSQKHSIQDMVNSISGESYEEGE